MIRNIITKLRKNHEPLLRGFFVFLACLCGADFFVERHETHFAGENISCFWSVFAFLGCLGMGFFCKIVLNKLLLRKEDYYKELD